jgi:D-alanyl-D-alanine dipeptidase
MQKYVGDIIWVRKSVAEKLLRVSNALRKLHPTYKLKIVFGYRHPEVQTFYFERRKNTLRADVQYEHYSNDAIEELADTMTANPKAAGHPTGAAVDLTILTPNGPLDMGTGIADFTDPEKIKMYSPTVTYQQAANRKLLHDFMVAEEFAPFYGEWWHYSYGDKEWAWFYKKPNAFYETIDFKTV